MRENRPYGSVRGVPGNRHSYRDHGRQKKGYPLSQAVLTHCTNLRKGGSRYEDL